MVTVKDNIITMTRGDSVSIKVTCMQNTDEGPVEYAPQEGDTVRFAMKNSKLNPARSQYKDAAPLITKAIDNEDMLLKLEPSDTKTLGFGIYDFDIQITLADGTVDTFIPEGRLILKPEVD